MHLPPLLRASPRPVRGRLLRDLVLLVLVTVSLVVGINALLIDDLKRDLASARIDSATALVRDEVGNLLTPVEQQLLILRDGLRGAHLGPQADQLEALNRLLMPTLSHMPQIASAIVADADGAEYFLRKDDDGWLTRLRPPGDAKTVGFQRWRDADHPLAAHQRPADHDPRRRPWFQAAVEALDHPDPPHLVWSRPYLFHSLQTPGITAATAWRDDGEPRVAALDVTLDSIIAAIGRLPLGAGGRGFLVDADDGVYAGGEGEKHPAETSADTDAFYSAQAALGGPLPFEAVAAWRNADRPVGSLVPFESGGRDWWGSFLPLTRSTQDGWVGVAVPVSETLGVLQDRWHIIAITALAILALGIGLAVLVVRRYSRQLRDLPKRGIDRRDPEGDLYDLIGRGEGTHLELKSTMRTNLHTGKPGKEIELAWLKGVVAMLNTEGGILLLGIADDGAVLGLEADAFANDDKCLLHFKNLVTQHIGAEHARLLRLNLFVLDDKPIGVVECERADAPIFLRHPKGESFLIRNGPSNIELPISKALAYIRGHF